VGYQTRNNFVKNENGDLLADSQIFSNRWKNYSSHLMNVCIVSYVRRITHRDEPLEPGAGLPDVEIAIAKFKVPESPGSDEILVELVQAGEGGETLLSAFHKVNISIWNKEKLPDQW
jgi:hypothetical protein